MQRRVDVEQKIAAAEGLEDLSAALEQILLGGYSIWDDGSLYEIKQLVTWLTNALRVEIRMREHSPPHFHVVGGGVDASFAIADCEPLSGKVGSRELRLIKWFHARSKSKLVSIWNATRPSDCPVGTIHDS